MLRPEHELTDYQRQEAAQRILNDAELIKRGATISAAGVLVLGECQAEYMHRHDEFPYLSSDFSNEEPPESSPKEEWLDTALNNALASRHPSPRDIPQPLRKMSIPIRDVLVLGRGFMDSNAMQQFGKKSIGIIDALIAENDFGLEWKDNPTPEDVAQVCQRLGQVTARVLRLDLRYGLGSNPSVLDVVRTPIEKRYELWRDNQAGRFYAYFGDDTRDRLCNYPELFALRFERRRWDIEN